jgi:hypothetical protein
MATVKGNPKVMRSLLGYNSASRSMNSQGAFEQATKYLVANMLNSMHKRLEVETLYGQMGLGTVDTIGADYLNIVAGQWAAGIWAGSEKMPIEVRSSAGALRGIANITRADLDNKRLYVDAIPVGTVSTDVIFYKGAYGNEFAGIQKIITNTGVLFGIDAAQFSLWQGNTYPVSGLLSLEKIELAVSKAIEKGLDNDVTCVVNPSVFAVMIADEAALRKYDSSYDGKQAENGFRSIKFHYAAGVISIEPSIYCKQGDAFIINMKDFMKIGSSDVTFKRPGGEDNFFRDLENSAAYELRAWLDLAIFTSCPGKNVYLSGITLS